jgi:hypothetical protein
MYSEGINRIKPSVNEALIFIRKFYNHIQKRVTPQRRCAC